MPVDCSFFMANLGGFFKSNMAALPSRCKNVVRFGFKFKIERFVKFGTFSHVEPLSFTIKPRIV